MVPSMVPDAGARAAAIWDPLRALVSPVLDTGTED
jgi:hypothetical protein